MPADVVTRPWEFAVIPFRIAGNVYYVGNSNVSSHLIDTGEGLILLDTAFPQTVYLLLESVRRLGFDPDDIRWILHCHAHYDHFGGTRALVELTGARTAIGQEDVEIVTDKPELSWAPEYGTVFYETFAVDRPLADGDVVRLGNTAIECVHIPGHTPGAMAFFFMVEDDGRPLRVGIHGGPGLNTLTDDYLRRRGLPFSWRDDYMRSLQRLKRERVDVFIGAHPSQNGTLEKRARMTAQHNPFVDPAAWPAFLTSLEASALAAFAADEEG